MKCDICEYKTSCIVRLTIPNVHGCPDGALRCKVSTNADRIRNMSDEELAELMPCPYMKDPYDECIHGWHDYDCNKCKLEWLQSEAEEISVRS
jgi:hypothetical protein